MKNLFFVLSLFLCISLSAQPYSQKGYVKTKGTKDRHGVAISSARVKFKNGNDVYMTDSLGAFTFYSKQKKYSLESVQCKGYEVLDYDTYQYEYDIHDEALRIVMVDIKKLREESAAIYNTLLREFQKSKNIISKLNADHEKLEEQLKTMAERLARVDYDSMEAKDREIQSCMENGEFKRADSLILSKGSIEERQIYNEKGKKAWLQDCYNLATSALLRGDLKLALYYLELRAKEAPDDISCLIEFANLSVGCITNFKQAISYYDQAIYFSRKQFGECHPKTLECKIWYANALIGSGDHTNAQQILSDCLSTYHIHCVKVDDEDSTKNNAIFDSVDSLILSRAASKIVTCYSAQGNYADAAKYIEIAERYMIEDSSFEVLMSAVSFFMSARMFDEALNFLMPLLQEREFDIISAPIYSWVALIHANKFDTNQAVAIADEVINFYQSQGIINTFVCTAVLAKMVAYVNSARIDLLGNLVKEYEDAFLLFDINSMHYTLFMNNKATYLLFVEEYSSSERIFIELNDIVLNDKNLSSTDLSYMIPLNLGSVYLCTESYNEGLLYTQQALDILIERFKDIGYDNLIIECAFIQMYYMQLKIQDYYGAYKTLIYAYSILKKDHILPIVDDLYKCACEDENYPKKSIRALSKEYIQFKKSLTTEN